MEIKDILSQLGIDLTNSEAKRGALEAIEAILSSRNPIGGSGGSAGGDEEIEVELDPDLLQPSIKQSPAVIDDEDIEIEDEEKILDQIKHNDSEEPIENKNSSGDTSDADDEDNNSENTDTSGSENATGEGSDSDGEADDSESTDTKKNELKNSTEDEEAKDADNVEDNDDNDSEFDSEDGSEDITADSEDSDEAEDSDETDPDDSFDSGGNDFDDEDSENSEDDEDDEEFEFDEDDEDSEDSEEFDFDEDDLIDDALKNSTEDEEAKTKHDARKIKRERTITAAKKALADAQARKVSPALIRELEKSIEALETLTEAVSKSLKDISDEEFNQLINRTLDAIQACGGDDLTFTSEEERAARVQEIKADLAKAETQNELSAEDVAKIRAETQAIKAREKEVDKYKRKDAGSFKGFQEFLNSLYKAIALQVSNEETRDDTWSAISRRNSGAGVLRQGQKVNDLPNKHIPIIDFYFDTSSSWGANDIKVGMKAVSQLADMEEKGQIKLNVFYFSDEVSTTPIRGGTSGWNEIVKNVIATQATNVVVMTDADMQDWWTGPKLSYTVPGYVWYLWKNGENAPRLPQDLKGRGGVQQFSFNLGDV